MTSEVMEFFEGILHTWNMHVHSLLAALAGAAFVASLGLQALRGTSRVPWAVPAFASGAFFAFSAYAVATEGQMGFWTEHVRHAWGNQIWFDLLLAASVGWAALFPRARKVGMTLGFWAFAVPATGSIALLAMYARLLYLEGRLSSAGVAERESDLRL